MIASDVIGPLVEGLAPEVVSRGSHDTLLRSARHKCLAGNPFPLVALQWPSVVITRPDEEQFFDGSIGDPENPCLRLDWWQRMILMAFFDRTIRELFVKGCTGSGKTSSVAMAANLMYDVHDELRLHLTSESFNHCARNIFGEVKKWRSLMRYPRTGNENASAIASSQRHYMMILNPRPGQAGESFSGAHSEQGSDYIFDEATAAEPTWFENAYKNARFVCAMANPRTVVGHFRQSFRGLGDNENKNGITMGVLGKRLCVTVGGMDCVNVTQKRIKHPVAPHDGIDIEGKRFEPGEDIPPELHKLASPLIPGQMDINQFRSIVKTSSEQWQVRCFAHGCFPDEDPQSQIVLSSHLPRHFACHQELGEQIPVNCFGLDVARSLEGDSTALSAGSDVGCRRIHEFKMNDYIDIRDEVYKIASNEYGIDLTQGVNPVCIDYGGGYGAGVGDPMHRDNCWVIANVPGGAAELAPHVFGNQRSEMYGLLGERLSPTGLFRDTPWAIPECEKLIEELFFTVRTWNASFTKYVVIPKEAIKAEIKRSPDTADAIALLWQSVRAFSNLNEYIALYATSLVIGGSDRPPPERPKTPGELAAGILEHFQG